MSRNANSSMGRSTNENADRGTRKKAGSGVGTAASAVVAPDELSEEDLKPAAEVQAASGDRHGGPPPGKAEVSWPSSKRIVGSLGAYRVSLTIVALAAAGTVVLVVVTPKALGQAINVISEGVVSTTLPADTTRTQAIEALRAWGMDDLAAMLSAMDVIPGVGIDCTRLGRVLTVVLGPCVGSGLLNWFQGWLTNRIMIKAFYRLCAQVEDKAHRPPLSYFDTVQRGELFSRLINDADNVTNILQQSLFGAPTAIPTVTGVPGMMFSISWKLALVALITFPLVGVVFGVIGPRSQRAFTHQWVRIDKINTRMEESFSGHTLMQVYGRTASAREAFATENEELFRALLRTQFLSGITMPIILAIGNINYVAIAVVGGVTVASGLLHLGDVQAFIQYSQQFSQPLGQPGGMTTTVQSGTASAERIFELLDAGEGRPDDAVPGNAGAGPSIAAASSKSPAGLGVIEMEHVRFSYSPEVELIRDLSLRVDLGHMAAVVGPTGAGKTILVNLLMRFYKLGGGRILIDRRDIATMTHHDVQRRTGMVLQDPWLFAGMTRENIHHGRLGASDEEVETAARVCSIDHIIEALPQGYDTVLEEDVANISASERQLFTIVRVFVVNPAVFILNEATSSVDARTGLLVQRAMNTLCEGRTSFIIAHRLSMIRDADTILVMEHGDIVEQSSHDELIVAGSAYARLRAAQFASGATVAVEG